MNDVVRAAILQAIADGDTESAKALLAMAQRPAELEQLLKQLGKK